MAENLDTVFSTGIVEEYRMGKRDFRKTIVPKGRAALSHTTLVGIDLSWSTLDRADFGGADLAASCLSGASLAESDFELANLSGADLSKADIRKSDFRGTKLIGASLTGADIEGVKFTQANLCGADLSGCIGKPVDREGCIVDYVTYIRSGWTEEVLIEWYRTGAGISELNKFPESLLSRVFMSRIEIVDEILQGFHAGAQHLRSRPRSEKKTAIGLYVIKDEYDVQDLLYAMLKPILPDLTYEDPVSKKGGRAGRVDLKSKQLRLIIEIKYCYEGKTNSAKISEDLMKGVELYGPDCDNLRFFIYDPSASLHDAENLARDLSGERRLGKHQLILKTIVVPSRYSIRH
jgi:hypothetical protein